MCLSSFWIAAQAASPKSRARSHKPVRKRNSADFRFARKATELLRSREMTRCAGRASSPCCLHKLLSLQKSGIAARRPAHPEHRPPPFYGEPAAIPCNSRSGLSGPSGISSKVMRCACPRGSFSSISCAAREHLKEGFSLQVAAEALATSTRTPATPVRSRAWQVAALVLSGSPCRARAISAAWQWPRRRRYRQRGRLRGRSNATHSLARTLGTRRTRASR